MAWWARGETLAELLPLASDKPLTQRSFAGLDVGTTLYVRNRPRSERYSGPGIGKSAHRPSGALPHLEQQAIPRSAIPSRANHFSVVNTLGESELDPACSIEGFQLFGGEFQIQTGEIVLELRYLSRSSERHYCPRLPPHPRHRPLSHPPPTVSPLPPL